MANIDYLYRMSNEQLKAKRLRLIVDLDRPTLGFEDSRNFVSFDNDNSFLLLVDWTQKIRDLRDLIEEHHNEWYPKREPLYGDFRLRHSVTGADLFDQNAP